MQTLWNSTPVRLVHPDGSKYELVQGATVEIRKITAAVPGVGSFEALPSDFALVASTTPSNGAGHSNGDPLEVTRELVEQVLRNENIIPILVAIRKDEPDWIQEIVMAVVTA